jgi:hypothetical protein
MDKLLTLQLRYLPLKYCGPWPLMFTRFGDASSWLYHRRSSYEWFSGAIRICGLEIEWCCLHDIRKRTEYYEGLIDKEFASAPVPSS